MGARTSCALPELCCTGRRRAWATIFARNSAPTDVMTYSLTVTPMAAVRQRIDRSEKVNRLHGPHIPLGAITLQLERSVRGRFCRDIARLLDAGSRRIRPPHRPSHRPASCRAPVQRRLFAGDAGGPLSDLGPG